MAARRFPDAFVWGTATSAHQVEGGNWNNDWWAWEHEPEGPCQEPSGDACDHWHRWPDDVGLCAELGFGCYRFSLEWIRVHDLPDFVYFDHSIHVAKGVGCASCHGRVDDMPLTWRVATLQMDWCLDCHRQPERYVRPRERVFDMAWQPPADQEENGRALVKEYEIMDPTHLTSCDTCHR